MTHALCKYIGGILVGLLLTPLAMAQNRTTTLQEQPVGGGQPSETLPPSRSTNEPYPQVPSPTVPGSGVVSQAGVGNTTGYGRPGVVEFGGSAGFTRAGDLTQVNFSPSIGWFVADNLQLSGILGINYSNVAGDGSTYFTLLVEPSYHLPFNKMLFGFVGLGIGPAYQNDVGLGFALAPRIGANYMVGRSGILTPALYLAYTTSDLIQTAGTTLLGVNVAYGLNIGYTVMF